MENLWLKVPTVQRIILVILLINIFKNMNFGPNLNIMSAKQIVSQNY